MRRIDSAEYPPPRPSDALSLRALGSPGFNRFSRWASVALIFALVAYVGITVADVALQRSPLGSADFLAQLSAILLIGVGLLLVRLNRAAEGVVLALGAIWLELHSSLVLLGLEGSSGLIVLPTIVVGAGLLLGGLAAFAVAGASSLTVPLAASFGYAARGGPYYGSGDAIHLYVVSVLAMFGSAILLTLGLAAFGRVLRLAQGAERRVADLLEHSPDGIVAADASGTVVSANPAAERLLGEQEDRLVGSSLDEVLLRAGVTEEDRTRLEAMLHARDGHPVSVEVRGPTEPWCVDAVATAVPSTEGEAGFQVTLRDVTEQRQAEASQQLLQVQLEHALRLEAVGRLAGGVAHDFNNLLTAVGGSAELILDEGDEASRELAREILEAQVRGAALTRQLLAFARKELIRPEQLDPAAVVLEMRSLLQRFLTEQVELCLEAEIGCPRIVADRAQFEQVIVNLAINAKDAMAWSGLVTVSVHPPGAMRVWAGHPTWEVEQGFVEVAVEDNGHGMTEETRSRIFEPFFTTKPRGRGTGLGLATVHGIVSQNGGSLRVLSEPGRGTVMSVLWPVAS